MASLCWISYETSIIQNISNFKLLISCRYRVGNESSYSLYLQNALLPDDEHIDILRDNDVVKIVFDSPFIKKALLNQTNNAEIHSETNIEKESEKLSQCEVLDNPLSLKKRNKRKKRKLCDEEASCIEVTQEIDETQTVKTNKRKNRKIVIEEISVEPEDLENNNTAAEIECSSKNDTITSNILLEGILELPTSSPPQRKKRIRKRKKKNANNSSIETNTYSDLEKTKNSDTSSLSVLKHIQPIGNGKHTRFDEGDTFLLSEDNYREENSLVQENNIEKSLSIKQKFNSSKYTSNDQDSKQQPKMKQINSAQTNRSVIILNCEDMVTEETLQTNPQSVTTFMSNIEEEGSTNAVLSSETISQKYEDTFPKTSNYSNQNGIDYLSQIEEKTTVLNGPPRVGDIIAYKLLELSFSYCPEVSSFKVGKVLAYEPKTDMLDIDIISQENKPDVNGKFTLQYSDDESTEIVDISNQVRVCWQEMLDARLFVV